MNPNDDEEQIVSIVQQAFERQTVTQRPCVKALEQHVDSGRQHQPFTSSGLAKSISSLVWSSPVAVAVLLVVILVWNASPLKQIEPDVAQKAMPDVAVAEQGSTVIEQGGGLEGDRHQTQSDSTPQPDRVVADPQVTEDAAVANGVEHGLVEFDETPSATGHGSSSGASNRTDQSTSEIQTLEATLWMLGRLMKGSSEVDSSQLAERLTQLGVPSSAKGLVELSNPTTINWVSREVPQHQRWLLGPESRAFAFEFDVPAAIAGLKRFVNASVGEDLFDPLLNGIRDDPDGPRIDLRRDFFANLTGKAIVAFQQNTASDPIQLILVLPCHHPQTITSVLDSAMKMETIAQHSDHAGHAVWKWSHRRNPIAATVIKDCLVVGDQEMVLQAIQGAMR